TLDDLQHDMVKRREPLRASWRGLDFILMPPPSSGGVAMAEILEILEAWERIENRKVADLSHNTPAYAHLLTEAMKHAFADRSRYLGDPDFAQVPMSMLLNPPRLTELAGRIDMDRTLEPEDYGRAEPLTEDGGTSHLSVIDDDGMAVACTETINLEFGSRIIVEGCDFFLNNQVDDFTTRSGQANAFGLRQSDRNLPAPHKKPLSSMSPTIVRNAETGAVEVIAGASGGPRIITGTLQAILNVLLFDMPARDAVAAPRFHHQWMPDALRLEPYFSLGDESGGEMSLEELQEMMRRVSRIDAFRKSLEARGHRLGEVDDVGVVQLIRRNGNTYEGAADPRKGGAAVGN
ncbi:MAG: gamma-glutamyltransferase, partial [Planctomycetota bacterium]|nr:gamma-glutamyltransferase [Planctomycetota bacterium]